MRKPWLTASKFQQICSRNSDFEGLVSQLKKKTVQTAAMKYGLEHESEAAQSTPGLSMYIEQDLLLIQAVPF